MLRPVRHYTPVDDLLDALDEDEISLDKMKRRRGRKRRTCCSCEEAGLRCDHCVCGVGGPRACANATNHPPGQCRRLKHDLNGQLVWGERTQRLSGTSRVTAMCENCQKVTVEDTPASTMPKPVTTGVKRSHHFKGFKKRAARTTDATAAHADGAEEMEMTEAEAAEEQAAATAFSGFASVAAAAAASLLSNSFGGMAGLDHSLLFPPQGLPPSFYVDAPLPPTSTAYSEFSIGDGGFRLTPPTPLPYTPVVDGPSAAKCSWSPVLRFVGGRPVTLAAYQAHVRARALARVSQARREAAVAVQAQAQVAAGQRMLLAAAARSLMAANAHAVAQRNSTDTISDAESDEVEPASPESNE